MSIMNKVRQIISLFTRNARQREKRRFSLPYALFWLAMMGFSLVLIVTPGSPIWAASHSATGQMNGAASRQAQAGCPTNQAVCDSASQNANSTGAPGSGVFPVIPDAIQIMLFFTDPKYTVNNQPIVTLWGSLLAAVDVFMVLIIVLNAIRIMVSGSIFRYADVAETFPRILLALVAAHISLAIIGIFAGISNGLSVGIYQEANGLNFPHIGDMLGFKIPGLSIWSAISGDIGKLLFDFIVGLILFLIKGGLVLMLIAQMATRIILIDIYIVVSGPCIACWALPGRSGQPITRQWLQGFISLMFVQFVQGAGMIVAALLLGQFADLLAKPFDNFLGHFFGIGDLLTSFMGIVLLWFILRIPSLLGTAPMQTIQAGGQMLAGAAGSVATTTAAVVMLAR